MSEDPRFVLNSLEEWEHPFLSSRAGFEEFVELFPRKYRDHPEIRVYYKALMKRFAVFTEDVKENIETTCQKKTGEDEDSEAQTEHEKAVILLEHIKQHLSEELSDLKNENKKMRQTLDCMTPDVLINFNKELSPAQTAFQAIENKIIPQL
ncbi:uncharacterized protein LOC135503620 isoform X2 [Lineus longissimus]|uniref:uncharacterized protein LOC135503620 isoform X2 n=1 Tax=Lineus longissimus TaxID=88925 RepID=UPI002B4FA9C2